MEDLTVLNNGIENIALDDDESFLYNNVESTECLKLEYRTGLGHVVVATKDVAVGTKIIREKPILVYEDGNFEELFYAFMGLGLKSKNAVLSMFDPTNVQPEMLFHAIMIASQLSFDPTIVHKLVVIDKYHSEDYDGSEVELYSEKQSAIFLLSSKLAHSCNPNTIFTIAQSDGRKECGVVRPIKAGDLVTYSLGQLEEIPIHIKRELLIRKALTCHCPKCFGPDYSRPIYCNKCRGGVLLCTYPQEDFPTWSCSGCENTEGVETHIESIENEVKEVFECWKILMVTNPHIISMSKMKDQIEIISSKLHPQHFHTLGAMKHYIAICLSMTEMIEIFSELHFPPSLLGEFGTPVKILSEAAKMGVSLIERIECIAANCIGPKSSGIITTCRCTEHAPVAHSLRYAFNNAQIMMRCPSSLWPTNGRDIVHRYLPIMKLVYGEGDDDIAEIEREIPAPENRDNQVLSQARPAMPLAAEKKAKQRRKNRGRTNKKKKGRK